MKPFQPSLFDSQPRHRTRRPPHNGTPTSIAAAESIAPFTGAQASKVAEFIRSRGKQGATRQEIADGLQMRLQSVCGRVNELLRSTSFIEQGTRPNPNGKQAAVVISAAQQSPLSERN